MSVMTCSPRHNPRPMIVLRWLMILTLVMMIASVNLIKPASAKVTLVEVTAEGLGMTAEARHPYPAIGGRRPPNE